MPGHYTFLSNYHFTRDRWGTALFTGTTPVSGGVQGDGRQVLGAVQDWGPALA